MSRIQIAGTSFGQTLDDWGNVLPGRLLTITSSGSPAVVYAEATGATTASPVSNALGYVAGWLEPGTYVVTKPDGQTVQVETVTGAVSWYAGPVLLVERGGLLSGGSTGADKVAQATGPNAGSGYASDSTAGSIAGAFWFDPAEHEVLDGLTMQLQLRLWVGNSDVATGQRMVGRMYRAAGDGSGATTLSSVMDAATVEDPGANASGTGIRVFDPPAVSALYALGLAPDDTTAANSDCVVRMSLSKVYVADS